MKISRRFICMIMASALLFSCSASEPVRSIDKIRLSNISELEKYTFINNKADTITDHSGSLEPFFAQLKQLSETEVNESLLQVPIIHYGDSHIQAGYLTEIIRRCMQSVFGNAGRGMIVPLKLASSNEPRDYSISSENRFESSKIVNRGPLEFDPGVSGIGVRGALPVFNIKVLNVPGDTLDYSFNRVVVFHDSLAPMITAENDLMADGYGSDVFFSFTTNIELNDPQKKIELYTYKDKQFYNGAFYGFSIENNNSGILYHSLGINGACYLHWGMRKQVAKQSAALNPALIIISMGANEASGKNFVETVFLKEVNSFVAQLKEANPNTPILITSPVEVMRRNKNGHNPNTNFVRVSNALEQYCKKNKLAYLDLFQIMGGINSSRMLDNHNLLQRDKIHFTIEGYTLQGQLIFNAIINDFLKYDR